MGELYYEIFKVIFIARSKLSMCFSILNSKCLLYHYENKLKKLLHCKQFVELHKLSSVNNINKDLKKNTVRLSVRE